MELIPTDRPHALGYLRQHDGNRPRTTGLGRFFKDLFTDETIGTATEVSLGPYQFMWLTRI